MVLRKFLWFVSVVLCFGLVSVPAQTPVPKIISGGVVNGKAISLPKPGYPGAKGLNASGTVNVEVIIDEQGNVESATAISGHPLLRASAVSAARQATFEPTTLSGVLVKVKGIVVYNFISGDKDSENVSESGKNYGSAGCGSIPLNGNAISLPKPEYPAAAQAVNASGLVEVEVFIDVEGNVTSAQAVSGHPLLRQSAEEAARNAKFRPTLLKGVPVIVKGKIAYKFAPAAKTDPADISNDDSSASSPTIIFGHTEVSPKPLSLPKPVYPAAARMVKASGNVTVSVTVDEEGNVESASAVSGHPLLRAAAISAARQAKFAPTFLKGELVKVVGTLTYNFAP